MIIHYASDLHLEFYENEKELLMFFPEFKNDFLVLAGDIGYPTDQVFHRFIRQCCDNYKHVIYVPGNHEYYNTIGMKETDDIIRGIDIPNFHALLDSYVDLEGYRFIGGTLFTYYPKSKYKQARKLMNDYNYYTPEEVISKHKNTVEFLDKNMSDKNIVVTHHLPSYTGISQQYKYHQGNYLFANHLDVLLRRDNVVLWFAGHTHIPNIVGKLHINPFGYPGESIRVLKTVTLV